LFYLKHIAGRGGEGEQGGLGVPVPERDGDRGERGAGGDERIKYSIVSPVFFTLFPLPFSLKITNYDLRISTV
jgi:hypothetical protein